MNLPTGRRFRSRTFRNPYPRWGSCSYSRCQRSRVSWSNCDPNKPVEVVWNSSEFLLLPDLFSSSS